MNTAYLLLRKEHTKEGAQHGPVQEEVWKGLSEQAVTPIAAALGSRMPRASTVMGSSVTGSADMLSLQGLEKKGKHAEVPV